MAGQEKDVVRIDVPDPNIKPRKTAEIQLPVREPMDKAPVPILIPTPTPAPVADAPGPSGLRKETVRVSDMPDSPAAEIKEIEPLIATPDVTAQAPSIAVPPAEKNSMLLLWILLGVSALVLIIQIWAYFS